MLVRSYNISSLLKAGSNTVGLWLGPGWTQFSSVNPHKVNFFNTSKAPLALAVVQFHRGGGGGANGERSPSSRPLPDLVTDATWSVRASPVSHLGEWQNSDFGGDRYDQRRELPGWAAASPASEDGWESATAYPLPGRTLSSDPAEPNQKREQIGVKAMGPVPGPGGAITYLYEMDEIFSGWLEVQGLRGEENATVSINLTAIPFDCHGTLNKVCTACARDPFSRCDFRVSTAPTTQPSCGDGGECPA